MVQATQAPPRASQDTEVIQEILPIVLKFSPVIELTEEQFAELCGLNDDLIIEMNANGELEIMTPVKGFFTGAMELKVAAQLLDWAERDGTGVAFGPSMGYTLSNGAVRAPDASWLARSRRSELVPEDYNRFAHIWPDFVIELRSETDRLTMLQAKMREYIESGTSLGFLIDPRNKRVYIYRPDAEVEILEEPASVSADPVLPGFVLELEEVWGWEF